VRIIADALTRDFGALIDIRDITHPDPNERRRNLLGRALAAMVVREKLGCDDATAASAVTDGGQDFGIDAVNVIRSFRGWGRNWRECGTYGGAVRSGH
jgi:hypothetical protein